MSQGAAPWAFPGSKMCVCASMWAQPSLSVCMRVCTYVRDCVHGCEHACMCPCTWLCSLPGVPCNAFSLSLHSPLLGEPGEVARPLCWAEQDLRAGRQLLGADGTEQLHLLSHGYTLGWSPRPWALWGGQTCAQKQRGPKDGAWHLLPHHLSWPPAAARGLNPGALPTRCQGHFHPPPGGGLETWWVPTDPDQLSHSQLCGVPRLHPVPWGFTVAGA